LRKWEKGKRERVTKTNEGGYSTERIIEGKRSNRELEASIKDEKGVGREVGRGKYAMSRRV
jgi:hypothetical protein